MISNMVYFLCRVLCNCLSDLWREISQNYQFADPYVINLLGLLIPSWIRFMYICMCVCVCVWGHMFSPSTVAQFI